MEKEEDQLIKYKNELIDDLNSLVDKYNPNMASPFLGSILIQFAIHGLWGGAPSEDVCINFVYDEVRRCFEQLKKIPK